MKRFLHWWWLDYRHAGSGTRIGMLAVRLATGQIGLTRIPIH